ncbi:hypothetical protein L3Q82_026304 [Scortum barcoo]|uniref:Uncharacterized protein n=1 Tax=Scortum barcoo TaxID=214431 RepID=A0ACB8WIM4_9TELE|nr:hypothetical protein L3Q82_026304 [Scortum barcoo]
MRFFVLVVEHWTSSIPSTGCLRVYGSLPNQSTCALWIWRRHSTVSLVVFCGGCSTSAPRVWGPGAFAKGCSVSVRPEQELGSHCRQGRRESGLGTTGFQSLLFADDVVLMASSGQDLQHVLERFAAECEAAGMRISTLQIWRPWFSTGKGWHALSRWVERSCLKWRSSSISGSCSRVRERSEREIDRRIGAASCSWRGRCTWTVRRRS